MTEEREKYKGVKEKKKTVVVNHKYGKGESCTKKSGEREYRSKG